MSKQKSSKTKPKKSALKKPKKVCTLDIPDSDEENAEALEELRLEQKPVKKRHVEVQPSPDSGDEEEQIVHLCGACGDEIECQDGQFSNNGRRFKCSCPKEKDGKETYYFCNEECLQGDNEQEDEGNEEDDWDEVEA